MSKRPGISQEKELRERFAYLHSLEERIEKEKAHCRTQIKEASKWEPLKNKNDIQVSLQLPSLRTVEKTAEFSSSNLSFPTLRIPFVWREKMLLKEVANHLREGLIYEDLCSLLDTMPSVDAPYWDTIEADPKEAAQYAQLLNTLSRSLTDKCKQVDIPFSAETHLFYMEKILAVLLKLSSQDPLLSQVSVDLSWLSTLQSPTESDTAAEISRLFASDPKTDYAVSQSRQFLHAYQSKNRDKPVLFKEMQEWGKSLMEQSFNKLVNEDLIRAVNESERKENAGEEYWEAEYILKKLDPAVKENVRKFLEGKLEGTLDRVEQEEVFPLASAPDMFPPTRFIKLKLLKRRQAQRRKILHVPETWVLAYAMSHAADRCFPPNYYAVKQHLLRMQQVIPDLKDISLWEWVDREVRELIASPENTLFYTSLKKELIRRIPPWQNRFGTPLMGEEGESFFRTGREEAILSAQDSASYQFETTHSVQDVGLNITKGLLLYSKKPELLRSSLHKYTLHSLLFSPGALEKQLYAEPEFARTLGNFVKKLYHVTLQEEPEIALFIIRLNSQLKSYCSFILARSSQRGEKEIEEIFLDTWKACNALWQQTQKEEAILKQGNKNKEETEVSKKLYNKKLEEIQRRRGFIAQEALAIYGRKVPIEVLHLTDYFRYSSYLSLYPLAPGNTNPLLDRQVKDGRYAMLSFFQQESEKKSINEEMSQALSEVIERDNAHVKWFFDKLPILKGSYVNPLSKEKIEYEINVETGAQFINDFRKLTQIPKDILTESEFQRIFPNPEQLTDVRGSEKSSGKGRYFFRDALGKEYRISKVKSLYWYNSYTCTYQRLRAGNWYTYCSLSLPNGISKCIPPTSIPWGIGTPPFSWNLKYDEVDPVSLAKNILFIAQDTGQVTHEYDAMTQLLSVKSPQEKTLYYAVNMEKTYDYLQAVDPYVQVWRTIEGVAVRVDLPNYGLVFDVKEGLLYGTGEHAGFQVKLDDYVKSLIGIPGYLLLEHPVTKERRVLLPMRFPRAVTDVTTPLKYESPISFHSICSVFEVVGKRDHLEGLSQKTRVRDQLYLSLLYLTQHKYEQAYQILSSKVESTRPYTLDDLEIFIRIINPPNNTEDESPLRDAVRLKARACLARNLRMHHGWRKVDKKFQYRFTAFQQRWDSCPNISYKRTEVPDFMQLTERERSDLAYLGRVKLYPEEQREQVEAQSGRHIEAQKGVLTFSINNVMNDFNAANIIWYHVDQTSKGWKKNLGILDDIVFSTQVSLIEFGTVFLNFYALAKDVSKEREGDRKRLDALLTSFVQSSKNRDIAIFSRVLQAIIHMDKEEKSKLPDVEKIFGWLKFRAISPLGMYYNQWKENIDRFAKQFQNIEFRGKAPPSISQWVTSPPLPQIARHLPPIELTKSISEENRIVHYPVTDPEPICSPKKLEKTFTEKEREIKIDKEKTGLNFDFVKDKTKNSPHQRVFTEVAENARAYAEQVAKTSEWEIDEKALIEIEESLENEKKVHAEQLNAQRVTLRALANKAPETSLQQLVRGLYTLAGLKKKVTIGDLQLLYLQGNAQNYRQLNDALTKEEIEKLYNGTAQLLIDATQQHSRERALKLIAAIHASKSKEEREELTQRLHAELTSVRAYNPQKNPLLLVYEYKRKIRLREEQVKNLQDLTDISESRIIEIIMGAGKTDVLLPLLALMNANGENLSLLLIPKTLIPTVAPLMQVRAGQTARTLATELNWKDTTGEGLDKLHNNLERIRKEGGFVIVDSDELHHFILEAKNLRHTYIHGQQYDPTAVVRLDRFKEIFNLLKKHGHAIIDEVHAQLRHDFEVHYALGKEEEVVAPHRQLSVAVFDALMTSKEIRDKFYFQFSPDIPPEGAEPYSVSQHKEFLINALARELMRSRRFKKLMFPKGKSHGKVSWSREEQQAVIEYLTRPTTSKKDDKEEFEKIGSEELDIPPFITSTRAKNILALARQQIQIVIPEITLEKMHGEHYGRFPATEKQGRESLLAGPWGGADQPRYSSRFSSYSEAFFYTIQAYSKKGVPPSEIEPHIRKLKTQMRMEIRNASVLVKEEETKAHKEYVKLFGKEVAEKYPLRELIHLQWMEELSQILQKNSLRIHRYLNKYVLHKVSRYETYTSSTSHILGNLFFQAHGVTGTGEKDKYTFPARFTVYTDKTITGKTVFCAQKIKQPIFLTTSRTTSNTQEQARAHLEQILKAAEPSAQALIDQGALLQDIPRREVAERILKWGKERDPPITSVVYYKQNRQVVLRYTPDGGYAKPTQYQPSPTEDLSKRFTFYDQSHCTGADIPQALQAVGVVTLNKKSDFQQGAQADWRMRLLHRLQKVQFAIPEDVSGLIKAKIGKNPEEITSQDILSHILYLQVDTQQASSSKALYGQLNYLFNAWCEKLLNTVSTEELRKPIYRGLEAFTVTKVKDEPYEQYGKVSLQESAEVELERRKKILLSQAHSWIEQNQQQLSPETREFFWKELDDTERQMQAVIAKALDPKERVLPETLPVQKGNPLKMEVQEVEVNIEQEVEQEQEVDEEFQQKRKQEEQVTRIQRDSRFHLPPMISWLNNPRAIFRKKFFNPQNAQLTEYTEAGIGSQRQQIFTALYAKNLPNQQPILTVDDEIALDNSLYPKAQIDPLHTPGFFSPDLLTSLNVASPPAGDAGNQRPISTTMLLIQDKAKPEKIQLLMLSKPEVETLYQWLIQDKTAPWVSIESRAHRVALFSPLLESQCGNGFVAEGAETIERNVLRDEEDAKSLNAFECLAVQSKFAMGETAAYSLKERAYLQGWFDRHPDPVTLEKIFIAHFLPRSVQDYSTSPLSALFAVAKARSEGQVKRSRESLQPPKLPPHYTTDYSTPPEPRQLRIQKARGESEVKGSRESLEPSKPSPHLQNEIQRPSQSNRRDADRPPPLSLFGRFSRFFTVTIPHGLSAFFRWLLSPFQRR
jgi:hypothetical protein